MLHIIQVHTYKDYNLYFGNFDKLRREENNFYLPLELKEKFLLNHDSFVEALKRKFFTYDNDTKKRQRIG